MLETKKCNKCCEEKDVSDFNWHKRDKCYITTCKQCQNKRAQELKALRKAGVLEMARPAKQVDIYTNLGEIITTTVKDFVEERGITDSGRKKLYSKSGWIDEEMVHYRVNKLPEVSKEMMNSTIQWQYNDMEKMVIKAIYAGDYDYAEEWMEALKAYEASYFVQPSHRLTTVMQWTRTNEYAPGINLDAYKMTPFHYGRLKGNKFWTAENTIDTLLDGLEKIVADKSIWYNTPTKGLI